MNEQIEKAWKKFFGKGWRHDETPSKIDCFEAGWIAHEEFLKKEEAKGILFQQKLEDFQS